MPKQIPWHLQEIFGASTVEESLDATTPVTRPAPAAIPVLDAAPALRDFSKCAGAASQIVQKIELQELTDMLCPIDIETLAERDAARFSPTQPKPGLEFVKTVLDAQRFAEEVLPTASALGSWTPIAREMFGSLIKMAKPSRKKVCNLRFGWKDGSFSCCPEESEDGKSYRDVKTNKVFNFLADCVSVEACKDHCSI